MTFILKYNFENTECCLAIYLKTVKCTLYNVIKSEKQIILLIKRCVFSHYNKGKHIYSATKVKHSEVNLEIKKINLKKTHFHEELQILGVRNSAKWKSLAAVD